MTLPLASIEYLSGLRGKIPNINIAVSHDGSKLGLVCYSITYKPNEYPSIPPEHDIENEQMLLWFAETFENIGASSIESLCNQIVALCSDYEMETVRFYIEGSPQYSDLLFKTLRKNRLNVSR
jgi:hypothetical protein